MKYNRIFCWVMEEDKEGFSKIKHPIEFTDDPEYFKNNMKEGDLLGISIVLANTHLDKINEIMDSNPDKKFCVLTYDSRKKELTHNMLDFMFKPNTRTYLGGHVYYGIIQLHEEFQGLYSP